MIKGAVNHAIRLRRSGAKAFQVLKAPSMRLSSRCDERPCSRIRTRQSKYLMARFDQFRHDCRADKSCSSCQKYFHCSFLLIFSDIQWSLEPLSDQFFAFLPQRFRVGWIEGITAHAFADAADRHGVRHDFADVAVFAIAAADLLS